MYGGGYYKFRLYHKEVVTINFGVLVFLNANFYEKDGEPRCYAQFAQSNGEVISFDARVLRPDQAPEPFCLCEVVGQMRQYGRSVTFVLQTLTVKGRLVEEVKK